MLIRTDSFLSRLRAPRSYLLFPYTTLFRSRGNSAGGALALGLWSLWTQTPLQAGVVPSFALAPRDGEPDGNCYRIGGDRKSTRLNSSHLVISYAVFCLKKKK